MTTRLRTSLSLFLYAVSASGSLAFAPTTSSSQMMIRHQSKSSLGISLPSKEYLTEDGGVQKEILFDGPGDDIVKEGTKLMMSYCGSLAVTNWSPQEVVDCWLSEQQGLDHLKDAFLKEDINEAKLTNADEFTEDYVTNALDVQAKIQCKKLVLAAKRLTTTRAELPYGHVFDTNPEYSYELGSNKLIKGMEIGLATMKPGEWSIITIRSDYGYGSEGYRKANGDVVVPPFATMNFEVQLYPEGITDLKGLEEYLGGDDEVVDFDFGQT
mmetsp:Transcript_2992/g.7047  ORF Transcript_2992/g.7047 Transcript_2992/m.7047 type:complete len:269 (-) Transcript_2992:971-1777(-)|eukprot:CAMPEP_0113649758 /NCGR_PEP_ID=MMETSP0017_2-20120614/26453_1 /TAXON_ID=2856 /ORGANISM="Cylindrotheca closterium" /LENGTH=268 /DNA_ID=CAMNT_0000562179 /DNA_START=27 /DNA_END=833 /DNA_ORIENTATION=- /assembly_acc=CAM_ASM_000147